MKFEEFAEKLHHEFYMSNFNFEFITDKPQIHVILITKERVNFYTLTSMFNAVRKPDYIYPISKKRICFTWRLNHD